VNSNVRAGSSPALSTQKTLIYKGFFIYGRFYSMKKIVLHIKNEPTNKPVTVEISVMDTLYSEVKLQKTFVDGKPAILPKKAWYVYYYFRNPVTGKMQKFMDSCKINKYKTVSERTHWGNAWVKAYQELLLNGFNPFTEQGLKIEKQPHYEKQSYSIIEALDYAFDNLIGNWEPATISDYKTRLGLFKKWLEDNKLNTLDIHDFKDVHFISFMNWLVHPDGRNVGATSQDNYKRCISSLFGKLIKDKIIVTNPVDYQTTKDEPIKNTPFTGYEVAAIKSYLLENDKQLYDFILFVIYEFLRPREIIRLTCGDFNLKEKYLYVKTKTDRKKVKKLIGPTINYLNSINVDSQPEKAHLFTASGKFEIWDASEKTKVDHFGYRFRTVKKKLNFNGDYGIYSFRHTAALDLYYSFTKSGMMHREAVMKLMPIIGHKNESTTEKYLRDVQEMLPKDYGEFYTLNF